MGEYSSDSGVGDYNGCAPVAPDGTNAVHGPRNLLTTCRLHGVNCERLKREQQLRYEGCIVLGVVTVGLIRYNQKMRAFTICLLSAYQYMSFVYLYFISYFDCE